MAALVVGATLFVPAGRSQARDAGEWVGSWSTAITTSGAGSSSVGFSDQSIRMIVHTSVGGERVRIRLSDAFGDRPLAVGGASVGLPVSPASPDVRPETVRRLTFAGSPTTTVYRGAEVVSDPVDLAVPPLADLVVTIYMPQPTGPASWHWTARQSSYIYPGDRTATPDGSGQTVVRNSFYFLSAVDVLSDAAKGAVVVLGDSISDGFTATLNANHRWPDYLAARIVSTSPDRDDPGVLNQALSGGKVTHDGVEIGFHELGLSALARLDSDVFGQTGVRTVIVQLGVNDILSSGDEPERTIEGLRQLAAMIRANDLRVIVSTITPAEGFPGWTAEKESTRAAVNAYLRGQHEFRVIDFDEVLRDPAVPTRLRAEWDSGDHIHPNDLGYRTMANAVPLRLL